MRWGGAGADDAAAAAAAVRKIFEGLPLVPAIKAAVAAQHDDAAFARPRPPFLPLDAAHRAEIDRAVALAGPQAG